MNSCINAEKGGLQATVKIGDSSDYFDVSMAYLTNINSQPSTTVNYVRILPTDSFDCPKTHNETDLLSLVGRQLTQNTVGLSCLRKIDTTGSWDGNGRLVLAPAAHIAISTGAGDYTVDFAPIYKSEPIADTQKVLDALPKGTIMLWAALQPIPLGWHVCDGTTGTIDLRGRFPFGTGADGNGPGVQFGRDINYPYTFTARGTTDKPVQQPGNSTNPDGYLKSMGNDHTHNFHGNTDATVIQPPSTYVTFIEKLGTTTAP